MGCINCGNYSLRIEIFGQEQTAPDPRCVRQLEDMGLSGQLELTMKSLAYPKDNWFRVCSLEEDLLHDAERHAGPEDWNITMGEVVMLEGITGWLEYTDAEEDFIILPYGAEMQEEKATDIAIITREEWEEHFMPIVHAVVPICDASGMMLNRAKEEVSSLEEAFSLES